MRGTWLGRTWILTEPHVMEVWASRQHSCGFGPTPRPGFCPSSVHILHFSCLVLSCQLMEKKFWSYRPPPPTFLVTSRFHPYAVSSARDVRSFTDCPSHGRRLYPSSPECVPQMRAQLAPSWTAPQDPPEQNCAQVICFRDSRCISFFIVWLCYVYQPQNN